MFRRFLCFFFFWVSNNHFHPIYLCNIENDKRICRFVDASNQLNFDHSARAPSFDLVPKGQKCIVNRCLSNFKIEAFQIFVNVCDGLYFCFYSIRSYSKWKEKGKRSTKHSNLHAHQHTRIARMPSLMSCYVIVLLHDDENTVTHTHSHTLPW